MHSFDIENEFSRSSFRFSWVSSIVYIQCAFAWTACLRYCMNSSLKQRLRTGTNPQQAFLLACYLLTSRGQCDFYEVTETTGRSTNASIFVPDYDLWASSKNTFMPNPSISHSHDASISAQLPYDFQFRHVYDGLQNGCLIGSTCRKCFFFYSTTSTTYAINTTSTNT